MNILYLSSERGIELENKHKVMYLDHTSKAGDNFPVEVYEKIREFKPDLLLEREFNNGLAKYPDIAQFIKDEFPKCKRAVWLIDSHVQLQWHKDYSPLFDYVFVAISKYVPILAAHHRSIDSKSKVFWLPVSYPGRRDAVVRNQGRVPFDIVFVGRWGKWFGERNRLIELLKDQYKEKFFAITDYANMEEYLRQGIISFNRTFSDDMNFRVFESIANGVELVTNDVPDLHLIKGLEERINIYHNDQELLDLIDFILLQKVQHDVIRTQIWVQNHHCTIHRHNSLLKMLETNIQEEF